MPWAPGAWMADGYAGGVHQPSQPVKPIPEQRSCILGGGGSQRAVGKARSAASTVMQSTSSVVSAALAPGAATPRSPGAASPPGAGEAGRREGSGQGSRSSPCSRTRRWSVGGSVHRPFPPRRPRNRYASAESVTAWYLPESGSAGRGCRSSRGRSPPGLPQPERAPPPPPAHCAPNSEEGMIRRWGRPLTPRSRCPGSWTGVKPALPTPPGILPRAPPPPRHRPATATGSTPRSMPAGAEPGPAASVPRAVAAPDGLGGAGATEATSSSISAGYFARQARCRARRNEGGLLRMCEEWRGRVAKQGTPTPLRSDPPETPLSGSLVPSGSSEPLSERRTHGLAARLRRMESRHIESRAAAAGYDMAFAAVCRMRDMLAPAPPNTVATVGTSS
eukprot:TRINITY_DN15872_c0_g1_i2.p1 TRINITY_DN15872_c0_g1~~TRINITY_DN15872_c0_g1_i2.p1  ORF type:complete len:416 (+),score=28.64 TRINITY_DN15872_c0_g1_i2:78-1250(+)